MCIVYMIHYLFIFVSLETYQLLCGGLSVEKKKVEIRVLVQP